MNPLIERGLSFLPKVFNWWLYDINKTKNNISVSISAQDGCCVIDCSDPSNFTLWLDINNANAFLVDIDRIILEGSYGYSAQIKAENLIGGTIVSNKSKRFLIRSYIEQSQVKVIKNIPDNNSIINHCAITLILNTKYNKIRLIINIENIICKTNNKNC